MFPPVLNKRNFVERFRKNEFGNRGPTWETIHEFLKADYSGLVHIRNRVAGGKTYYNIPDYLVEPTFNRASMEPGVRRDQFYFAAMAPHDRNLIQGEVMRTHQGLYLFYSLAKNKPMREALAESPRETYGIIAQLLLENLMCPASYEWTNTLLDRYPDHVIEFSTFDCEWGVLPGYNSVWWEVRAY